MPYQFSDQLDDELLYERCESFGGGMDAFTRSTLLAPDQWQFGRNIVIPDNLGARTRPGADLVGAAFGDAIQGLIYFDTPTLEQLITACNLSFFKWEGSAWAQMTGTNEMTLSNDFFEAAQGIDKVLITDGIQQMQTWDGVNWSAPLGSTANDPPVGCTILCWHTARMFAAGHSTDRDTVWVSNRLAYGAGQWNTTTRSFRVGGGEGDPIVAMASMQQNVLAVLKENSVWLVTTDPTNEPANFSISQDGDSLSTGIGCVGRKAWARVGNDLHFMARDGVRTVQRMAAAASQYELTAPSSEPIQNYIDRINWTFAKNIAAKKYKELVLWAVPLDASTTNNAVLVFNTRLGRWIGVWDNWSPVAFEITRFNAVVRLVFGQVNGSIRQWKDFAPRTDDDTYKEDGVQISSEWWSRGMLFGEPVNDKDGYHCEARFTASNAIVTLTAVADGSDLLTWERDLREPGVDLPVDLPFDLATTSAIAARRGLRSLKPFNEIYIKIQSSAGWWELRNVTLSAYLNTLKNQ